MQFSSNIISVNAFSLFYLTWIILLAETIFLPASLALCNTKLSKCFLLSISLSGWHAK